MVVVLMMSGILTTLNLLKRKIFQNKIYHVTQITYSICSCDPSLLTLGFLRKKSSWPQLYNYLTRKTNFFEGWYWFKFNNFWLTLGMALKSYTSVAKRLKLKVRKFWRLTYTFLALKRKNWESRRGWQAFYAHPIFNRVKLLQQKLIFF